MSPLSRLRQEIQKCSCDAQVLPRHLHVKIHRVWARLTSAMGRRGFLYSRLKKYASIRSGDRLEVILSTVTVRRVSCGTPGMPPTTGGPTSGSSRQMVFGPGTGDRAFDRGRG